jgi:hypothetical protein
MPKSTPKAVRMDEPEFVSVARVRAFTGCNPGTLLTLVARGLVETRLDHFAGFPLYRLSDVRKYMPPKRGRPSKESLIAMAKAKKPKGAKG